MAESLKHRSLGSVFWALSESTGAAVISLIAFLGMARLLEPVDFGIVAMAGAVVLMLNLVIGHGFPDALVQAREIGPDHVHTAFWSTLAIALLLAAATASGAGTIARITGEPAVTDILHWLALILPLNAMGSVQTAMLRRDLRFRDVAGATLVGRTAGAVVGLTMAALGGGAWSLVGQQLAAAVTTNAALALVYRWMPRLRFSTSCFRSMAGFGLHVSAGQLISGIAEQAVNLMLGILYGPVVLGYFNIAWRTMQLLRSLIASALYQVGFSMFSRLQDNSEALRSSFLQATQLSCLVGLPLGIGLALVAPHLIVAFYGAKWAASVPILAWLALHFIPVFFAMFFTACYRAKGRADWVLYLMAVDLVLTIAGILALRHEPVVWVAAFWVCKAFAWMPVHVLLLRRLLGVGAAWLLQPVYVPAAASLIMGAAVFGADRWLSGKVGALAALSLDVAVGMLVYWIAIRILSPTLQRFALSTIKTMAAAR
ncbi:MAG: oligosaccharide flippase family protein [Alphaproteobacteria bacterium]|nr:oligosaccharide flippase family protein [Alphaproteobacteria bacterium]